MRRVFSSRISVADSRRESFFTYFGKRGVKNIVEILLCEGRNVEQWLKTRNISLCLCLDLSLSTLSLFISCFALHCSYYIHALYCSCALIYVKLRERQISPHLLI